MPIVQDNTDEAVLLIELGLSRGVLCGIETAKERMIEDYSQAASPPTSNVGEFPHIDSGQLVDNIAAHMNNSTNDIEGGVGVYGRATPKPYRGNRFVDENIGGLHALFLKTNQGRRGIDDSFLDNLSEISVSIVRCAT